MPRHSDVIEKLEDKFVNVLDWFASSEVLYAGTKFKWFCTFRDRCHLHIIKDQYLTHVQALQLVEDAFGKVLHAEMNEDKNSSTFFCPQIHGYVLVNTHNFSRISLAIDYDSDFDVKVCEIAEEKFYNQGFRKIEHRRPISA